MALPGGCGGPPSGRRDGPRRAGRVLPRGRGAVRAQATPHRRRRAPRTGRGCCGWPAPRARSASTAGRGRSRRWPRAWWSGGRRARAAGVGRPAGGGLGRGRRAPRRPRGARRGADRARPPRDGAVARRAPRHGHASTRDGDGDGVGGGRRAPRRGGAAVLRGGCGAPGPRMGPERGGGGRTRPGRCSTSPSGPSGSCRPAPCPPCEVVVEDDAAARRARWAIPSSLLSPRRRGWRPGCRPSWPVGPGQDGRAGREHSGRALLTGGARRAVARVLGTGRHRAGSRRPRRWSTGGFEAQARQALANLSALLVGTPGSAGPTW